MTSGGGQTFDTPALYSIVVEGQLAPDWSERLGGMQVLPRLDLQPPRVQLTGWLRDQTELRGVLDTLLAFALPIISVERIRTE